MATKAPTMASAAAAAAKAAAPAASQSRTGGASSVPLSSLSDAELAALELESDQITSLRLDGLALSKIVKHSRDAHPHQAHGTLLGLDIEGALEVSNVFALPNSAIRSKASGGGDDESEETDKGSKSGE